MNIKEEIKNRIIELTEYGVQGMKWGVQRARVKSGTRKGREARRQWSKNRSDRSYGGYGKRYKIYQRQMEKQLKQAEKEKK